MQLPKPDLSSKKILVAPLDWGLGHATRCMPLIDQLLAWNARVVIGGDGRSLHLLKREYPGVDCIDLPGYDVRYTTGSAMVAMTMAMLPKYIATVAREHRRLDGLIDELGIDRVISDNRYGLWSRRVPSTVICHQISVIPPEPLRWAMPLAHRLHLLFLNRFDSIWIPDFEGPANLTGILSHRYPPGSNMRFIGALSRFDGRSGKGESNGQVLVVLSGPEPQRTVLEELILQQAAKVDRNFVIVQGKTESLDEKITGNVRIVSFMDAGSLLDEFARSELVVARSGYSTVMDLYALGKKAVFIPTPGQTEQEYLAAQLAAKGMAVVQKQSALDLGAALEAAGSIPGFPASPKENGFADVLREFAEG